MSNGNITTVLDKTALTLEEIIGSIVLYAIKGTGAGSDKQLTVDDLKEWISQNLTSAKIKKDNLSLVIDERGLSVKDNGRSVIAVTTDYANLYNLVVNGTSVLWGSQQISENLSVGGETTLEGNATLEKELHVKDSARFDKGINVVDYINTIGEEIYVLKNVVVKAVMKALSANIGTSSKYVSISNGLLYSTNGVNTDGDVVTPKNISGSFINAKKGIAISTIYSATTDSDLLDPKNLFDGVPSTGTIIYVKNSTEKVVTITKHVSGTNYEYIHIYPDEFLTYVYDGSSWKHAW